MVQLKSVSELSTRNVVDLYTIIVFLGFSILLFWLSTDRYHDFVTTHKNTASNATEVVANAVSEIINNKQHDVDVFAEDFHDLISELSARPDDEELHQAINNRINKYLPDFFATNVMTSLGLPVIGDFDGNIGELCISDLKHYLETGQSSIRVHPNVNVYHYDLISRFKTNKGNMLFLLAST